MRREEAMFHLAVLKITSNGMKGKRAAIRLLQEASRDDDYPQATDLIEKIRAGRIDAICVCRRFLRTQLKRMMCPLHQRRRLTHQ
jgi:hypothetical protein